MLKISSQHSTIGFRYGIEGTLKILAEAGFEAVDLSITGRVIPWDEGCFTDVSNPEFREFFENIHKCAEENNIEICMTHAPYCAPFIADPEAYAKVQQQTIRAVYATKLVGSPYIVSHPVLHPDFNNGQNRERGLQTNVDYFSAIVPALKETGVVMCIENLYWGLRTEPKTPNICTKAEDLAELIDTLNEMHGPYFAACLDVGHAVISGEDPCYMLKVLGPRTKVLHIHDNMGILDNHTVPGEGIVDWEAWVRTLKEVGYCGCFNFETDAHWESLLKDYFSRQVAVNKAKLLYEIGRSLQMIE